MGGREWGGRAGRLLLEHTLRVGEGAGGGGSEKLERCRRIQAVVCSVHSWPQEGNMRLFTCSFFHCRLLLLPLLLLVMVVAAVVVVGGDDKSDAHLDDVPNNVPLEIFTDNPKVKGSIFIRKIKKMTRRRRRRRRHRRRPILRLSHRGP